MNKKKFPRFPRAFMSVSREEFSSLPLTIRDGSGNKDVSLPDDLKGHVFIMAFAGTVASPNPPHGQRPKGAQPEQTVMPAAGKRVALFDGDGMIYRLDFHQPPHQPQKSGQAWLTSQLLKPPAFFADQITYNDAKQKIPKYKDLQFWDLGFARLSALGSSNQLNTALAAIKYRSGHPARLVATNDATQPYEIDPCSLRIISPIGSVSPSKKIWKTYEGFSGLFPLLLSSAHPCTDWVKNQEGEHGELFTINVVKSTPNLFLHTSEQHNEQEKNKVFLINWKVAEEKDCGKLDCWEVTHQGRSIQVMQSTHMLGITKNYVILADTAMKFEQIESIFMLFIDSCYLLLDPTLDFQEKSKELRTLSERLRIASRFGQMETAPIVRKFENIIRFIKKELKKTVIYELLILGKIEYLLFHLVDSLEKDLEKLTHTSSLSLDNFYDYLISKAEDFEKASISQSIKRKNNQIFSFISFDEVSTFSELKKWKNNLILYFIDRFIKNLKLLISSKQNSETVLYLVRRNDLSASRDESKKSVEAIQVKIPSPFAHFFVDYDETEEGKIIAIAPMAYAFDAAEYINKFDRAQWSALSIKDLTGMIPLGVDSNCPALIEIDPTQDNTFVPYELSRPENEDPIYIGLYAYRDDMPTRKLTDIYWLCGGAFPEMVTQFIHDLYHDYSPRRMSLKALKERVAKGIPMEISHMAIDHGELQKSHSHPLTIVQKYVFEPGVIVFSLQFVPRTNSTLGNDGYLICTVVHSDHLYSHSDKSPDPDWSDNSELWIFDARCVEDGPQYKLSHPRLNLGMTLHSIWLPEISSTRQDDESSERQYSFKEDYADWIAQLKDSYPNYDVIESLLDDIDHRFKEYLNDKL